MSYPNCCPSGKNTAIQGPIGPTGMAGATGAAPIFNNMTIFQPVQLTSNSVISNKMALPVQGPSAFANLHAAMSQVPSPQPIQGNMTVTLLEYVNGNPQFVQSVGSLTFNPASMLQHETALMSNNQPSRSNLYALKFDWDGPTAPPAEVWGSVVLK